MTIKRSDPRPLTRELRDIAAAAETLFGRTNAGQLNWKPNPQEWSIAQCFEHLILVNHEYFPLLERIARGEWRPTLYERLPLLPKLFGAMVLKALQPDSRRKVQARPRFVPSNSAIAGDIIARFVAHQDALCDHVEATGGRDWNRTVITSPVVSVLTYSLFDAYRIVLAHERLHLAQAERVSTRAGFPR